MEQERLETAGVSLNSAGDQKKQPCAEMFIRGSMICVVMPVFFFFPDSYTLLSIVAQLL